MELSLDWRSVGLRGLAALAFGILILVWPGLTVLALVLLFGLFVIVDGFAHLVAAFRRSGQGSRGWLIFEGVAAVAAGIITLVWPDITTLVLLYVIGAWAVIIGVIRIVAAVQLRGELPHVWLLGLTGALSVVFGIILFVAPVSGALAITWLIGFFALFVGILFLALAWRLRKAHGSIDVFMSPPPAPA
ncbi:MAG: HdeD family acid-resistance protein [Acidimicrobiia bacterium]|nr:HdeD family acid-resistance protein [Acidimicrobiia bacterium]